MRVRFTSPPGDSAVLEAAPEEDTPEYSFIDALDSGRLYVLGEEIENGRPRLIIWILFGDLEQPIYMFDRSTPVHPTGGALAYHRG